MDKTALEELLWGLKSDKHLQFQILWGVHFYAISDILSGRKQNFSPSVSNPDLSKLNHLKMYLTFYFRAVLCAKQKPASSTSHHISPLWPAGGTETQTKTGVTFSRALQGLPTLTEDNNRWHRQPKACLRLIWSPSQQVKQRGAWNWRGEQERILSYISTTSLTA